MLWFIYNKLITKTNAPEKLGVIYSEMAWLINKEDKGCIDVLRHSQKMHLLSLKGSEQSEVLWGLEILAIGCDKCKKLQGNKYTIDEALEKMPIPNPNCTHAFTKKGKPFCRCCYLPVIK